MGKETIICIIIVVIIVIGNSITQDYTVNVVSELSNSLIDLKDNVSKDEKDINKKEAEEKIKTIESSWEEKYTKLAYFIEHDELEKVESYITAFKSYIQSDYYADAISEIDKSIFVLRHIEEKYAFSLENIF